MARPNIRARSLKVLGLARRALDPSYELTDHSIDTRDPVVDRHLQSGKALLDGRPGFLGLVQRLIRPLRLPVHLEQVPPDLRPLALRKRLVLLLVGSVLGRHLYLARG